jgi:hypothetical protein
MRNTNSNQQEGTDREIFEEINQLNRISLGEGAVTCQLCGYSLLEGDAVAVYVFRPAGAVTFQFGYVMCGAGRHEHPSEWTLGVRELVVAGRIGVCEDVVMQSSWLVLLAPTVLCVSSAASKTLTPVHEGSRPDLDTPVDPQSTDSEPDGPVPLVEKVVRERACRRVSTPVDASAGVNGGER